MQSEWIFIAGAVADLLFVFLAARLGREWLLGSVIANLLLIIVFGGKLISLWGFITNAGNVPYACAFLAADFLIERYGRYEGRKTVWLGAGIVAFFVVMAQLISAVEGLSASAAANAATTAVFALAPRVFIGSIAAYIIAQYVNIWLYDAIHEVTGKGHLWLRVNASNVVAQFLDSSIFFSVVFFGLTTPLIVETILVGWAVKILVVALGTPLLYLDRLFPPRAS